jgi:hypothetical protein
LNRSGPNPLPPSGLKSNFNYAERHLNQKNAVFPGFFWVLPSREAAETAFKKNPKKTVFSEQWLVFLLHPLFT